MKGPKYMARLAQMQRFIARVDGSIPVPLPASGRVSVDELKAAVVRPKTPMMKALDVPEGSALENMAFYIESSAVPRAPNGLWLLGARSRILKAAIVAGTVESQWAIPDCFTFIQDIIADRETRLGESEEFDPNINFGSGVRMENAEVRADEDEEEEDR